MSWVEKSIDELGFVSRGKSRHRPRDAAHLYGGPYPFIQTGDVKHAGLYLTEYSQTYSEAGLAQSKLWSAGTLCITIAANIADTSILAIDACFPDSVIGFIADTKKADARFIKYLFDVKLKLSFKQFTQGAAQDNLSQGKLLSLKFLVPEDVRDQKRIADHIAIYDNLIENNRRRIQLLEESARLLYREWFVHLRFPGHEHVKIVDGVPEGWKRESVGDLLGNVKRKAKVKKEDYQESGLLPCVDQSREFIGGYIDDLENAITEELPLVVFGDHTRIVKYVDFPFVPGADGTQLLIPKDHEVPRVFFYFLITSISVANAFYARHFKFLKAKEVLIPTKNLMKAFEDAAKANMDQISKLRDYNRKLAEARDLLLPRLMNGTISV